MWKLSNKEVTKYAEINRKAWNSATLLHQKARGNSLDLAFSNNIKHCVFSTTEADFLNANVGIAGKDIFQPCCNNGLDLVSLKNMGARRCLGVDISDNAISEARNRCARFGYDILFIQTNLYQLDISKVGIFDLIFISVGTIRWLHNLVEFFRMMMKLLRPGGKIYIREAHPLTEIINDDRCKEKSPMEIITSYDTYEPLSDNGSLDYIGHTNEIGEQRIWFIHSFDSILSAIIENRFHMCYFAESKEDITGVYSLLEGSEIKIPLSFTIIAQKN